MKMSSRALSESQKNPKKNQIDAVGPGIKKPLKYKWNWLYSSVRTTCVIAHRTVAHNSVWISSVNDGTIFSDSCKDVRQSAERFNALSLYKSVSNCRTGIGAYNCILAYNVICVFCLPKSKKRCPVWRAQGLYL